MNYYDLWHKLHSLGNDHRQPYECCLHDWKPGVVLTALKEEQIDIKLYENSYNKAISQLAHFSTGL